MRALVSLALIGAAALLSGVTPALPPLDEKAYAQVVASHKGGVLLVDFWATWCAPFRAEMPQLVRLTGKYRGKGVRLVTVSCDEPEDQAKAAQFLSQQGAMESAYLKRVVEDEKFINFVDGKWSGALPALFLYDRSGRLVRSFVGETDVAALEQAIRNLP